MDDIGSMLSLECAVGARQGECDGWDPMEDAIAERPGPEKWNVNLADRTADRYMRRPLRPQLSVIEVVDHAIGDEGFRQTAVVADDMRDAQRHGSTGGGSRRAAHRCDAMIHSDIDAP